MIGFRVVGEGEHAIRGIRVDYRLGDQRYAATLDKVTLRVCAPEEVYPDLCAPPER